VASSVKFGLITHSKQQLRSTETLNHWMASKSESEKYQLLKNSLSTQAFLKEFVTESSEDNLKNLIKNKDLDKELVRDHHLPLKTAKTLSKVMKNSFGYLLSLSEASEHSAARPKHTHPTPDNKSKTENDDINRESSTTKPPKTTRENKPKPRTNSRYQIQISGQDLNAEITVSSQEDLLIVDTLLQKIRFKLLKEE